MSECRHIEEGIRLDLSLSSLYLSLHKAVQKIPFLFFSLSCIWSAASLEKPRRLSDRSRNDGSVSATRQNEPRRICGHTRAFDSGELITRATYVARDNGKEYRMCYPKH